jgi:hypothetical protein
MATDESDGVRGNVQLGEQRFWRQVDIVLPEELPAVTVIGAGGIGSFTLLALAKMGCQRLTVFDDDKVEDHNLPNQLYGTDDIGLYKVDAADEVCFVLANTKIYPVPVKFSTQQIEGVVISGVDSMTSRKDVWKQIKHNVKVPLYIEARMGAEVSRIHSVNPCDPDHVEWYESTLYSDDDAVEAPCTARAIIYNGFAIAALIANQVKKFAKREEVYKEIIFDLKTLTLMTQ